MELENARMEERLRELKQTLLAQKSERESRGYSWRSGKKGAIASHASEVLAKNSERRQNGRRMRILQDSDIDVRDPKDAHRASKVY